MAIARGYRASPAEKDEATARRRRPEADHGHQTQLQRHGGPLGLGARRQASPFYQLAASATMVQRDSFNAERCAAVFLTLSARPNFWGSTSVGVAPRMQKRPEPDGPEPLVCGKIGKIAACSRTHSCPLSPWPTGARNTANEKTSQPASTSALLRSPAGWGWGWGRGSIVRRRLVPPPPRRCASARSAASTPRRRTCLSARRRTCCRRGSGATRGGSGRRHTHRRGGSGQSSPTPRRAEATRRGWAFSRL